VKIPSIRQLILAAVMVSTLIPLILLAVMVSTLILRRCLHPPTPPVSETPPVKADLIPPGILLTESQPSVPPPAHPTALGDALLLGYASPQSTPQQDLTQLARAINSFLTLTKTAATYPLSANEEWSAALRGKRPGSEVWLSDASPALDSQHRLIDRWQHPLHFHALGKNQWKIRSAGPDGLPFTPDDLVSSVP
jgi:hypothetical protein